jgi:hypothetical protein
VQTRDSVVDSVLSPAEVGRGGRRDGEREQDADRQAAEEGAGRHRQNRDRAGRIRPCRLQLQANSFEEDIGPARWWPEATPGRLRDRCEAATGSIKRRRTSLR